MIANRMEFAEFVYFVHVILFNCLHDEIKNIIWENNNKINGPGGCFYLFLSLKSSYKRTLFQVLSGKVVLFKRHRLELRGPIVIMTNEFLSSLISGQVTSRHMVNVLINVSLSYIIDSEMWSQIL